MNPSFDPLDYLQQAEVLYTASEVEAAISKLADEITQAFKEIKPLVMPVMGGAVVFSGMLLPKLNFPLEFDYVQASRYQGTAGQTLKWKVRPPQTVKGRHVLLLDDILDVGITLAEIKKECLAMGALSVKIAVLTEKVLNQVKPVTADFAGLTLPNRYIFGCGMDVHGWWRNLPAIYALKE